MLLKPSKKNLGLGVGNASLAVVMHLPGKRQQADLLFCTNSLVLPSCGAFADDWVAALAPALDAVSDRSGALTVTLGDEWARLWVTPPAEAVRNLSELQSLVRARGEYVFGIAMDQWMMQAHWQVHLPTLACALPRGLVDGLKTVASHCKIQLVSLQPLFLRLWNLHRAELTKDCWFCVFGAETMTAALIKEGQLIFVRQYSLDALPGAALVHTLLEREILRFEVSMPELIFCAGRMPQLPSSALGLRFVPLLTPHPNIAYGHTAIHPTPEGAWLALQGGR